MSVRRIVQLTTRLVKIKPPIDYQDLLRKYIQIIICNEGITYLEHFSPGHVAPGVKMTQRELDAIQYEAQHARYGLEDL